MAKYQRATTPKGVAQYPWLTKADTKFNTDGGDYKTNLVVSLEAKGVSELIEKIETVFDEHVAAVKAAKGKKPRREELPFEVDEDEGTVTFKIKKKRFVGQGEKRFEKKIAFFSAGSKTPIPPSKVPAIYGGSELAVALELLTWENQGKVGVRLEPLAVQIIQLSAGRSADAESYGFGEEEGGYTFDDSEDEAPFDSDADAEDEGEELDDF